MHEIIYKLDNWTIIKILGGIAVIMLAFFKVLSQYFLNRISQSGQHGYDKKLEEIKGVISKGNSILNTAIESYISSSQKLLDKKVQSYEVLWSCVIHLRSKFPAGIVLVYQLFPDNWFKEDKAFNDLNDNPKMGSILRSYDLDEEMKTYIDISTALTPHKPYISDKSYKLYSTYQALTGRITHQFIWSYSKYKVFDWKKDKPLQDILRVTLTERELAYIISLQIGSLNALIDLLEYKILQDFRDTFNIKDNQSDTISYLRDIEQILSTSK